MPITQDKTQHILEIRCDGTAHFIHMMDAVGRATREECVKELERLGWRRTAGAR